MDDAIDTVWNRAEGDGPEIYRGASNTRHTGQSRGFADATDRLLNQISAKQATAEAAQRSPEEVTQTMESFSKAAAYATKGNVLFPGTQAQADAAERRLEDALE